MSLSMENLPAGRQGRRERLSKLDYFIFVKSINSRKCPGILFIIQNNCKTGSCKIAKSIKGEF